MKLKQALNVAQIRADYHLLYIYVSNKYYPHNIDKAPPNSDEWYLMTGNEYFRLSRRDVYTVVPNHA